MPVIKKTAIVDEPSTEPTEDQTQAPEQGYYLITAREYLVTFPPYQLILYPGTSAVLDQENLDTLAEIHRASLEIKKISKAEYLDIFAKQGKIGWVNK
jgi:hypothetical protein